MKAWAFRQMRKELAAAAAPPHYLRISQETQNPFESNIGNIRIME